MRKSLVTTVGALLIGTSALAPAVSATASTSRQPVRVQRDLPDFNPSATSAVSPTDVWVVGNPEFGSNGQQATFEHWDGENWSRIAIPTVPKSFASDVAALSASDAWSVGWFGNDRIMHWNGSSWSTIAIPGMSYSVQLVSLSADAANDVWAVGQRDVGTRWRSYVVHWDGTSWSTVPTRRPAAHVYTTLRAVSVVDAQDVWATGYWYDSAGQTGHNVIDHWDGTRWTEAHGVDGMRHLTATVVTAVSATDVWAAGGDASGGVGGAPLFHWDGTVWSQVANPAPKNSSLSSISAISSTDVWAVGQTHTGDHPTTFQPLSMHWDGSAWTAFPMEGGHAPRDFMTDISADRSNDVWACGYSAALPIIRHWDGSTWS